MPKVSVIMPVYNGEKYLREAIDSILGQTYKDFEFIIINDCSSDATEAIVLSYLDSRIVYIKNEENLKIAATLNRALQIAKGKYIARMDADDIAVSTRLEKQVKILDSQPQLGVLGSNVILFGEGIKEEEFKFTFCANQAKANMFYFTCVAHPTVMIRKEALDTYGLSYELDYEGMEDFVLWWRIAKNYDIASIEEPLLYYRQHTGQVTKNYDDVMKQKLNKFLKERLEVFNDAYTTNEEKLLLDYCCNSWDEFDDERIMTFIDLLIRILNRNAKFGYYEQGALRHTMELSVSYVIQNSRVLNAKKLHRYAIKRGVMSKIMAIKLLLRGCVI